VSLERIKSFLLKRNAVEESRKIMETKQKELTVPIGFLSSFQDDYCDPNGKQLLQAECSVRRRVVWRADRRDGGHPAFNYKWKLIRKLGFAAKPVTVLHTWQFPVLH
jgi:hypothetical protein